MARLQRLRRALQIGFFALFLLAPALDLLRFDLEETQLWVLGHRWSLGIDEFTQHRIDATQVALNIVLRAILPGAAVFRQMIERVNAPLPREAELALTFNVEQG